MRQISFIPSFGVNAEEGYKVTSLELYELTRFPIVGESMGAIDRNEIIVEDPNLLIKHVV